MKIFRADTHSPVGGIASLFNDYRVFYKQPADLDAAIAFVEERLKNQDSVIFVASDEAESGKQEKLIGFTQLYPSFSSVSMKRQYVLNDLFVSPEARKQGVGKALLKHAQSFATNEPGCKGLELATAKDNVVAQGLYEQLGFERDEAFFHYGWTSPSHFN